MTLDLALCITLSAAALLAVRRLRWPKFPKGGGR